MKLLWYTGFCVGGFVSSVRVCVVCLFSDSTRDSYSREKLYRAVGADRPGAQSSCFPPQSVHRVAAAPPGPLTPGIEMAVMNRTPYREKEKNKIHIHNNGAPMKRGSVFFLLKLQVFTLLLLIEKT